MISKLFPLLDQHKDGAPLIDNTYRVLLKIGEGKFAKYKRVKLVYNLEKQKYQAMKILKTTASEVQFKRFVNEIEVMFSISDQLDSKINILDVNFDGILVKNGRQPYKVAYYVMDFVEYGELYNLLDFQQTEGMLTENSIKFLFKKILNSVKKMHEEGIAHRDIKGENILLSHDLSIKFCDFGSCIDCNRKFKKKSEFLFNEEEMQEPIGSLGFNAPEVNNKEYEFYDYQKADIFSIGCLLFQAVVGKFPFKSSSREDPFYRRLRYVNTKGYWDIFETEEIKFNENFKDLIEKMLIANFEHRISIEGILNHPWFTGIFFLLFFKEEEIDEENAEEEISSIIKHISKNFVEESQKEILEKNWSRFKGIPMRRSRPGSGNNFNKRIIRFVLENGEKLKKISEKIKNENFGISLFKKNLEVTEFIAEEKFGNFEEERKMFQKQNIRPQTPKKEIFTVTDWLRRCSSSSSYSSSKSNSQV